MNCRRWTICFALKPASTRIEVVSDSISVQFPALPLPKTVTCIPTRTILHRAPCDSSPMKFEGDVFSLYMVNLTVIVKNGNAVGM